MDFLTLTVKAEDLQSELDTQGALDWSLVGFAPAHRAEILDPVTGDPIEAIIRYCLVFSKPSP